MSAYVVFRCGEMTLLLDADAVQAVTELDDTDGAVSGQGMVDWQGQAIDCVDFSRLLEQPGAGKQALVLTAESTGGTPLMLIVDSVDNVLSLEAGAFRPLPPMSGRMAEFFDAVRPLEQQSGLGLRLRYPLPGALRSGGA